MKIQQSAENYLETILVLSQHLEKVRSIDIANELKFSKPSVSVAMKNLKEDDYIKISIDGRITLTEKGKKIAEMIYERHQVLSQLLIHLGVDENTASQDACMMEHVISKESFAAIKQHLEKLLQNSQF